MWLGSGTYLGVLIEGAVGASFEFHLIEREGVEHAIDVIEVAGSGHAGKGCNCGDNLVHLCVLVDLLVVQGAPDVSEIGGIYLFINHAS